MHFGFVLPMLRHRINPTELPGLALKAEELGFHSVWTADHIAVPSEDSEVYGEVIEQLTTLSYIAAKTTQLKVGTSVLVLPQRNPLLVAKQAAAMQILSEGRLILGVGAGWVQGEFKILGADFANRGRIMNEEIRLMRAIWNDPIVNFSGKYFHVENAVSFPKPTSPIPVWIGGNSDAAVRRAIKLGDAWHPINVPATRVKEGKEIIEKSGKKISIAVRSMASITPEGHAPQSGLSGSRAKVLQGLEEYGAAGTEYFLLQSGADSGALVAEDMVRLSRELLSSF